MKKMKKAFALLIAAVLVLSMSVSAFAAETGSITIENAEHVDVNGKTFNAYKILDATFTEGKGNQDFEGGETGVAYTVPESMVSFFTTRYPELESKKDAPNFGQLVAEAIKENESGQMFEFAAAALEAAKAAGIEPQSATGSDGKAVISGLPFGYYIVEDTSAVGEYTAVSALMVQTVGGATIKLKADKPSIDKVIVEADSAKGGEGKGSADEVGSVVNFKVTSAVPNMTGYKSYTYIVHDTMTAGLSFNNDVKVTVGGKDYTDFTVTQDGQSFTVTFNNMIKETAGEAIVITYSATINEKALNTKEETNTVFLEYSNNPNAGGEGTPTDKTPPEIVYVYDFDIVIDKYDKENQETKLEGAEFVLYKGADTAKKYYKWNEAENKLEWVEKEQATVVKTDAEGKADFKGLEEGIYYLEEVKAPAGYNMLEGPVKIEITAQYNEDGTIASSSAVSSEGKLSQTQSVSNSTGTVLPETGGIGTTIFYIVGGILAVGAVILLVTKKRMTNESR